jgi:hypothetical protein
VKIERNIRIKKHTRSFMTPQMRQSAECAPPWSNTQDQQLCLLAKAKIPVQVIGFRLGRRPEAVARRARELGVTVIDRNTSLAN